MRITIQVLIKTGADQATRTVTLSTIERDAECALASGLGLFLGETHEILGKLQAVVLREEVAQFIGRAARCMRCRLLLGLKDTKTIVYRTAFGKARLDSPRFYSARSRCKTPARSRPSFSPLAEQLPERVHPQWLWLQSRYAAALSYRQAQTFLRDAFSAGRALAVSSVKRNVRRIGERLDREAQLDAQACIDARLAWNLASPAGVPELALQVDAGYIRAALNRDSARWIGAVVSKLVARPARRGYTHAYAGTYNPHQGVRQQAFPTSIGVPHDAPMTVLADGGEDVLHACMLPRPTEWVLDWFHIAMRFEHLLVALRGLRHAQPDAKAALVERTEVAKWLRWHGRSVRCLARLEALRRDTGWIGARNPLGRLIQYLRGFAEWLIAMPGGMARTAQSPRAVPSRR